MKVFNVLVNEVYNFETTNSIYSFLSKEDAEAKVKQLRDNYMEQMKPDPECYEITDETDEFECYPDGNCGEEHYSVQIHECEVETNYHDLRTMATALEIGEFMDKVNAMPADYWDVRDKQGTKVYPMPEDENGTTCCVILADVCDGYIYVEVKRIVRTSNGIYLECTADGGEYKVPLSFVMDGYLQEVTSMI